MKHGMRSLVGAAVLACLAPLAQAGLIIDSVDVSQQVSAGATTTVTHDLSGKISSSEDAVAGLLILLFTDGFDGATETAQIDVGATTTNMSDVGLIDLKVFGIDTSALVALNSSGKLDVSIKGGSGSFFWLSSTLGVLTGPGASGVPEPGTLALLGVMLVGLGIARRGKIA